MSQNPKKLGLWKHEPGSRTFDPLKTWAKAQKSLVLWKQAPGSIVLQVSISCTHSIKKKKLHAWTTFGLDPPTKRYVGNLPRDSVHILIHYMIICIFIYMHHTFTTVKYWLQSLVSFSYIDIRFSSSTNEGHSVDTPFCNMHLTSHGG